MAYLQRAEGHYICGVKMRDGSEHAAQALARQGRYQDVRDNLRAKEVKLALVRDVIPGRRWIICRNPLEAQRDRIRRAQQPSASTSSPPATPT